MDKHMKMIMAESQNAQAAYKLARELQEMFANKLSLLSKELGQDKSFEEVSWLRDEGLHGGGSRFEARDFSLFNTASVNVSQVHYDEMPEKNLKSATAISTIIHPKNPLVPSMHMHISLTELRDGSAYWRLMADLNPSNLNASDKKTFDKALAHLGKEFYEEAKAQGDKYFNIPALKRTRGVSHFYLENFRTADAQEDYAFALAFGQGVIDTYVNIITDAIKNRTTFTDAEQRTQLEYHTLYLFQVLTLDRGTTFGLMVHSQNDVGIMGSLPTHVDKKLLHSWASLVPAPQDKLVNALSNAINDKGEIDVKTKEKLAQAVREHYKNHPEALSMQASGNTIPSTVSNHQK